MKTKQTLNNSVFFQKYLPIDALQYENIKFNYYVNYCVELCIKQQLPLKALVTNEHLIEWFLVQWAAFVENGIVQAYGDDLKKGIFDDKDIFLLLELFFKEITTYPAVLLDIIKLKK